jgi:hypothetical protein
MNFRKFLKVAIEEIKQITGKVKKHIKYSSVLLVLLLLKHEEAEPWCIVKTAESAGILAAVLTEIKALWEEWHKKE